MLLQPVDWLFIIAFFILSFAVGVAVSKRAGKSSSEFFLSGRNMPWWLLGVSMVATTFSTDTPNLVTDIVRNDGVAGNWVWWAFLLTGMLTVFVYAKLWRRSSVMTDVEFYEIRYSGKPAAFLRGFRALYLGIFFNVIIMASVSLAAIKLGGILLGLKPWQTILIAGAIVLAYTLMGGLKSVLFTDFFLFSFAMTGAVIAAVIAVRHPDVGGLDGLFSNPNIAEKLSLLPSFTGANFWAVAVPIFLMPIAVQWWSVWYPGAEPGGGGYQVQRMLSAKNEKHSMGATLLFNAAHYALRPWPWILVALASLAVFPELSDIQARFPDIPSNIVKHDLAYPAMLTFLPTGLMGIVMASLFAAYMSTMASHLNWGSSYIVNDFWRRFVRPRATEKEGVMVGRISTFALMLLAGVVALWLENALQAFRIVLQIGAGTGLIFILRWFWWRINAFTELAGMIASFLVAVYFEFIHHHIFPSVPFEAWQRLLMGVGITTVCWVLVTFLTRPADEETLRKFYRLVRPGGTGWDRVIKRAAQDGEPFEETALKGDLPLGILCMVLGCMAVYSAIFAVGLYLYSTTLPSNLLPAIVCTVVAVAATVCLIKLWSKLQMK